MVIIFLYISHAKWIVEGHKKYETICGRPYHKKHVRKSEIEQINLKR